MRISTTAMAARQWPDKGAAIRLRPALGMRYGMASGVAEFLIFLLIIIIIKESLADAAEVTVTVEPLILESSGDSVNVSWSGVESPSEYDWLGIYTPPESEDENFIGYVLLNSSASWSTGAGSKSLPLVSLRAPYQFRLFRGRKIVVTKHSRVRLNAEKDPLPTTENRLATSVDVSFKNYNEPTQVHLSLTSKQVGEMKVMFVTGMAVDSYVRFGLDRNKLDKVRKTEYSTYFQKDMCDAPANTSEGWRDPGYLHNVVMDNLRSGKRYYYQVGSDEYGWSAVFSYVAPEVDAQETRALIFGDLGTVAPYTTYRWWAAESENTLSFMQQELAELGDTPVFVAHIGDISYARGYAWVWDEFFHRIQPISAQAPYHVCIGNHEYDWPSQPWKPDWASDIYGKDGGGECGVPYSLRFQMPGNSSVSTGTSAPPTQNLFFSHSFGVVHFLYMSTETDFLPGSEQFAFIADDLARVDRVKTPFIVLMGHRPMYTTDYFSPEEKLRERMLEHIEPLLVQHNVSLALWGHVHKYERSCPLQQFNCVDSEALNSSLQAPVHLVVGMGGQDWQSRWRPREDHPEFPIYPQPSWSMFRGDQLGYATLHATREVLTVSYVGNHDGKVHDMVQIFSGLSQKQRGRWLESWKASWLVGLTILGALISVVCYTQNRQNAAEKIVDGMPYAPVGSHELTATKEESNLEL